MEIHSSFIPSYIDFFLIYRSSTCIGNLSLYKKGSVDFTQSLSWLLMAWWKKEPRHQQPMPCPKFPPKLPYSNQKGQCFSPCENNDFLCLQWIVDCTTHWKTETYQYSKQQTPLWAFQETVKWDLTGSIGIQVNGSKNVLSTEWFWHQPTPVTE